MSRSTGKVPAPTATTSTTTSTPTLTARPTAQTPCSSSTRTEGARARPARATPGRALTASSTAGGSHVKDAHAAGYDAAASPAPTGEPAACLGEGKLPSHAIRALASPPAVIDAWRRNDPPGLPPMASWNLAGPRRAKQGRGGATSLVTTVRGIIRCPLLNRVADLFPPADHRPALAARSGQEGGSARTMVRQRESRKRPRRRDRPRVRKSRASPAWR